MKSFAILFSIIFFAVTTLGAQSTTFKATTTPKSIVKTTPKGNITTTSLKPKLNPTFTTRLQTTPSKTTPTTSKRSPTTLKTSSTTTLKTSPTTTLKTSPTTTLKTSPTTTLKTSPTTTLKTSPTTLKISPTTLKTSSTTLKTSPTTLKTSPTTLKTSPTSPTTSPTTTLSTTPTTSPTTSPATSTAPTSNLKIYKLCDGIVNSTEMTGRIQPLVSNFTWEQLHYGCFFRISSYFGYVNQLTCSTLTNLTWYPDNYLLIQGTQDSYFFEPEINRVYTSSWMTSDVTIQYVPFGYPRVTSWFDCSWKTIPDQPLTSEFQLCLHESAYATNGTVQYPEGDMGSPRVCSIVISDLTIDVPIIQISCSTTNSTSEEYATNYLSLTGIMYNISNNILTYLSCVQPVSNQVYYGRGGILLSARVGNGWGFKCNWTTTDVLPTSSSPTTPQSNNTLYRLCKDKNSTETNGIIKMLANVTKSRSIGCQFAIQAPPNQRVQLFCQVINEISLQIEGAVGSYKQVALHTVYTSIGNRIDLTSVNSTPPTNYWSDLNGIWIECKWTTIAATPPNAEFKLCQDSQATTTNGTIRSFEREPGLCTDFDWRSIYWSHEEMRYCSFLIIAPPDYRVQMSCSVASSNYGHGDMLIQGTLDSNSTVPIKNRIYTSLGNTINVTSSTREPNWIQCKWTTIPKMTATTDFKLCRDREATTANGTIQPLDGETLEERWCDFSIFAPLGHRVEFICPVMNITSVFYKDVSSQTSIDIVKNTTVISTLNVFNISTYIYNFGWIECKWTTLPPTVYKEVYRYRKVEAAGNEVFEPLNTLQGP